MSQENIAKHFGVSVDTIVDRAKSLGLSRDHSLRNKIRHQTNVEKHGEDYSKKKYNKYRETMIERYGRDNFFSGEEGKEEVRESTMKNMAFLMLQSLTLLNRRNVKHAWKSTALIITVKLKNHV